MKLSNVYDAVKSEKKNRIKEIEVVQIPKDECIAEHKRLIDVLRNGNKKALEAEAKIQEEELAEYEGDEEDEMDNED
jgi:hypothetical protein